MHEMTEALGRYRLQLSATGKELPEVIAARINEASEALGKYRQQISNTGREISDTISIRINEASEAMTMLSELSRKPA
jgi:Mg2+ and Co2+ transporter CorA